MIAQQPQREPHVGWFGRSEENRLLIIEDDHCKVFLDAELQAKLYSVIDSARPHTPALKNIGKNHTIEDCTCNKFDSCEECLNQARTATLTTLDKLCKICPLLDERPDSCEGCVVGSLRQSITAGDKQQEARR